MTHIISGSVIDTDHPLRVDQVDRIDRLLGRLSNYDVLSDGTITALNGTVEIDTSGLSTVGLGISGTWVGTIVAEITVGDAVWDTVPLIDQTLAGAALSMTSNGNWLLGVAGALRLRLRASLWTSGTAVVYLEGTSAPAGVFLSRSIPTGLNTIGNVGIIDGGCDCSGLLTTSSVIKATPGILKGVTMEMTDVGGDGVVEVWDSPNSTLAGDTCLARITVTSTTSGDMASRSLPVGSGVTAAKGIYMKIVTGDVNVIVYYE